MELDVAHSIVLRPDEGEVISDRNERTVRIKAGFDAIAVTETRYEPGELGPDAHIHRRHTDAFYVLEGTLDFELGRERETIRLPAGSFVAAPPDLVHSFRNDGSGRARFLNFHAPSGGFADYLRALRDGEDGSWFDQRDPPPDGADDSRTERSSGRTKARRSTSAGPPSSSRAPAPRATGCSFSARRP